MPDGQFDQSDERFMRRALDLAIRGLGRTAPNPAVGAVVVRDGLIVGEGWHRRAGEPHAEPEALRLAGERARGASLYVTLEPCCHYGRTPPCTDAIIAAGVARVFYACPDPDPRCAGRGEAALRAAGIEVREGPLGRDARRLNEAYTKHKRTGLPFVTLKLACSLDGKIATRTGDSRWVTGPLARERVHQMRDRNDAVMVGVGTVLSDDPALTTRLRSGGGKNALRVVLDTDARTPLHSAVLAQTGEAGALVAVGQGAPEPRAAALEAAGAQVARLPEVEGEPAERARLHLPSLMRLLGERGVLGLLCEGGARLAGALLAEGLVDRLVLFYAPLLVGDAGLDAVVGLTTERMAQALRLGAFEVEQLGEDLMVTAEPCSQD